MGFWARLFEEMKEGTANKECPECGEAAMRKADDTALVCDNCGYSVDIDDYEEDYMNRLEQESGFYD